MKINALWHSKNKMKKNPTLSDRISWHREHIKHCLCREAPENIKKYL